MAKYHIGDRFVKKYTRDSTPLEIVNVVYKPYETEYVLKPVKYCGENKTIGEEALIELYEKL